jgi:biotin carboxylase
MKTLVRAAGIATAEYAPLESPGQLRAFISRNGLPCVVKPRTSAGSRGVRVLQSQKDVESLLTAGLPDDPMVECFIDAPMFHVDGLVTDGTVLFISASRYLNSCISFQTEASHGSALLDPAGATSAGLVAATKRVLDSLPPAPHLAFHAEFFADGANRMVFCEIAARPGGSRTADPIRAGYGIDIYEQWVRRSFGLPVELPPARPWSCAGRLLVPPKRGRLVAAPASTPFDWVIDYRLHSQIGQRWEAPVSSGTNVATFVVAGDDTDQTDARMRELDTWFRRQVEWSCDC